jgi:hypothetical protein
MPGCNAAGEPDYSLSKHHHINSVSTNEERQTYVRCSRRVEEREKHVGSDRCLRVERKECALLGYYAASSGNFLSMFEDNL